MRARSPTTERSGIKPGAQGRRERADPLMVKYQVVLKEAAHERATDGKATIIIAVHLTSAQGTGVPLRSMPTYYPRRVDDLLAAMIAPLTQYPYDRRGPCLS